MSYGTWAWIAVAWFIGSFIFSVGIGLIFGDDDRYEEEYLSGDMMEMTTIKGGFEKWQRIIKG